MSGRGAYYKNKYGRGRGRGRGGGGGSQPYAAGASQGFPSANDAGDDWKRLQNELLRINGKQYGVYKDLLGQFRCANPPFTLSIDYVQGDPYAAPSRVSAIVPWGETGFPDGYLENDIRRVALCDFVTRVAADIIRSKHLDRSLSGQGWSGPKGGAFNINSPGQEVLPRTSVMISGGDSIEMRFTASLPAAGRTILGEQAWQLLVLNLVELIRESLLYSSIDQNALDRHILSVENQHSLRAQLRDKGLIAFVANGSILPRASGAAALPMDQSSAIPFRSPKETEVSLECSDGTKVLGMGIPQGITLLTGGGFHGKSTLLEALELGVYNHIAGDGRERVVTDPTAVKIRAEDGRSVSSLDISPFINNLPGGKDTKHFITEDASGSTSMAANIQEALEAGCNTLLIDEDSSATNLLIRDQRMQMLIKKEPITTLISKARALFHDHGVSTVIVIGGLGEWLSVSDNVIGMDSYVPHIITHEAKNIVQKYPTQVTEDAKYGSLPQRKLQVDLSGFRSPFAKRKSFITLTPQSRNPVDDPAEAEPGIELSGLDQIVEVGQSRNIAGLLDTISKQSTKSGLSMADWLQNLDQYIGVDKCMPIGVQGGDKVAVRRFELAAALARCRSLITTG